MVKYCHSADLKLLNYWFKTTKKKNLKRNYKIVKNKTYPCPGTNSPLKVLLK